MRHEGRTLGHKSSRPTKCSKMQNSCQRRGAPDLGRFTVRGTDRLTLRFGTRVLSLLARLALHLYDYIVSYRNRMLCARFNYLEQFQFQLKLAGNAKHSLPVSRMQKPLQLCFIWRIYNMILVCSLNPLKRRQIACFLLHYMPLGLAPKSIKISNKKRAQRDKH